jgi:3-oxoacyl-[acyl-carrier-protein] synthase II
MKRDEPRIWVTGIGVVAACGIGREAFWAGVRRAHSPVKRIDRFDPSAFRSQVAAEVEDFEPLDHMDARTARLLDRFSQFGLAAGRLALVDARWTPGDGAAGAQPGRTGVYLGSALGGIAFAEAQHERYLERGIRAVSPMLALAVFGGAAPANLGIALNVRGPILSTANSCASGSVALGEALGAIRSGEIDAAIAGGVECPLSPLAFGAFDIIRALSAANDEPEQACRPFDRGRDGFVMGEGAAMLVLERADLAEARGAQPYAELMGYGATSDAHHMVQPRPDGLEAARAATIALTDAAVQPGEIEYVNAHASSTPIGDVAEARALALTFGEGAGRLPVSGTKALYGHPLGASGAIEAAICALTIRDDWAPPSVNLTDLDDAIEPFLPCLIRTPGGQPGRYRRVLSTSFGFGGLNAALVLGSIDD